MKVCFVAENAYPVIAPGERQAFGGMETQAWAFARALQQQNCCDVRFAVSSPKRFRTETHAGIDVINRQSFFEHLRRQVSQSCLIQHSWPPLRILKWSNSLLWRLPLLLVTRPFRTHDDHARRIAEFYSQLSVDVVIAFGVSSLTTAVIEAAGASGKRTVISCASNDDLRAEYCPGSNYVNAYGEVGHVLSRGLLAADQIFVQTAWQQELARNNLNLEADLLPNPIDEDWTVWAGQHQELLKELSNRNPELHGNFVLWTGRTDRFHKRPEMAFDVARNLPQHRFVMVINATDPEYAEQLEILRPPNVLLLPSMPYAHFIALMSRATAFLSTGSGQYEGFPNVFLQAGILGVPVVSADCDFGILSSIGIGRSYNNSVPDMVQALDQICTFPDKRRELTAGVAERTRGSFRSQAIGSRLWSLLNSGNPTPSQHC